MKYRRISGKNITAETISALDFLVKQMKKGYTAEEADIQMRGSYGETVATNAILAIKRNIHLLQ